MMILDYYFTTPCTKNVTKIVLFYLSDGFGVSTDSNIYGYIIKNITNKARCQMAVSTKRISINSCAQNNSLFGLAKETKEPIIKDGLNNEE